MISKSLRNVLKVATEVRRDEGEWEILDKFGLLMIYFFAEAIRPECVGGNYVLR